MKARIEILQKLLESGLITLNSTELSELLALEAVTSDETVEAIVQDIYGHQLDSFKYATRTTVAQQLLDSGLICDADITRIMEGTRKAVAKSWIDAVAELDAWVPKSTEEMFRSMEEIASIPTTHAVQASASGVSRTSTPKHVCKPVMLFTSTKCADCGRDM